MELMQLLKSFVAIHTNRVAVDSDQAITEKAQEFTALCLVYAMMKCPETYVDFDQAVWFARLMFGVIETDENAIVDKACTLRNELLCPDYDDTDECSFETDDFEFDCSHVHFYMSTKTTDGMVLVAKAIAVIEQRIANM